jgi:hypothetical protein
MFIRYSRILSLIFPPTVYHRQVLLSLLFGNERFIWYVAHVNASWNMSKRAWFTSLPDSTPQRHAAAIPDIKLSHFVQLAFLTYCACARVFALDSLSGSIFVCLPYPAVRHPFSRMLSAPCGLPSAVPLQSVQRKFWHTRWRLIDSSVVTHTILRQKSPRRSRTQEDVDTEDVIYVRII